MGLSGKSGVLGWQHVCCKLSVLASKCRLMLGGNALRLPLLTPLNRVVLKGGVCGAFLLSIGWYWVETYELHC